MKARIYGFDFGWQSIITRPSEHYPKNLLHLTRYNASSAITKVDRETNPKGIMKDLRSPLSGGYDSIPRIY